MTSTSDIQTVTGARAGVIKLGLDVHASSIVVVRQIDAQVAWQTGSDFGVWGFEKLEQSFSSMPPGSSRSEYAASLFSSQRDGPQPPKSDPVLSPNQLGILRALRDQAQAAAQAENLMRGLVKTDAGSSGTGAATSAATPRP